MGTLADDRSPRPRRRGVRGLAMVASVAAGLVALLAALPSLLPSVNPFGDEAKDRSEPVLRKSLENLSQYRAASANLQIVVDVEQENTQRMLEGMMRGLGFERVTVTFRPPSV